MPVDLHIHTSYSSDGDYTPLEILSRARKLGLKAISICDHDAVDGSRMAVSCCREYGVEVLPSIELTTFLKGRELHILAYYVDTTAPSVLGKLFDIRRQAEDKIRRYASSLRNMGIDVTYEEAKALCPHAVPTCSILVKAAMLSGKNLDIAIFREYLTGSRSDQPYHNFFLDHMRPGGTAYVEPPAGFGTIDAIGLISENGGVPVIAHPAGSLNLPREIETLDLLRAHGLAGVEVYSSYHSEESESFLLSYAQRHKLVVTAGSDFHGPTVKPNIVMGELRYNPYEIVDNLRATAWSSRKEAVLR